MTNNQNNEAAELAEATHAQLARSRRAVRGLLDQMSERLNTFEDTTAELMAAVELLHERVEQMEKLTGEWKDLIE